MPHEYAHQAKSDRLPYSVVERMLKASNLGPVLVDLVDECHGGYQPCRSCQRRRTV